MPYMKTAWMHMHPATLELQYRTNPELHKCAQYTAALSAIVFQMICKMHPTKVQSHATSLVVVT